MFNKDLYKKNFQKLFIAFTLIFFIASIYFQKQIADKKIVNKTKVYWFIPDGLRADREQFNIFEWAKKVICPI